MPNSKSSTPFVEPFKRGFKSKADKISIDCRKLFNLTEYDPLDSFLLAKHLNLELTTPQKLLGSNSPLLQKLLEPPGSEQWSAITLANAEKPCLIIYNDSHSDPRIESDIMHELAHLLLGHKMEEIDLSFGIPLRKFDKVQENEAEWLGACLQLPKPALIRNYIYRNLSMEKIAEIFNASLPMVKYRIGVCGIQILKMRIANKK